MNSINATANIAQFATLTTVTAGATTASMTFTDAGSITAKAGLNAYVLANGTNTFTTATLTSGAYSLTGGTGADTFNTTVARLISAGTTGTVAGGTGTDVLNFTDNTALTVTTSNISAVEKINFANTDTNIAFATGDGMVGAGETVTFDATSLTTGTLSFNGVAEQTGATANLTILAGGTGSATITGGYGADKIATGLGAATITGGQANDTIVLGSGHTGIQKIVFSGNTALATQLTANGVDAISGFTSIDTINVAALGDGTTAAASTAITAAAAQGALTSDTAIVISANGAAANLTTAGAATITDWTNMTQVGAYLTERFLTAGANSNVIVFNNTAGNNDTTYVYSVIDAATAGIANTEIQLMGVITHTAGTPLTAANVVYA